MRTQYRLTLLPNLRTKMVLFMAMLVLAGTTFASSIDASKLNFTLNPVIEDTLRKLHDTPFAQELAAISANNVPCSGPGSVWSYLLVSEMGRDAYEFFADYSVLDMPFIYKLYIDQNEEGEYFGVDGSQTEEILMRQEMTEAFWKKADGSGIISTDNILLLGAHGSMLEDSAKLAATIELMFDNIDANDVEIFVGIIQDRIKDIPLGANNPLLTANALAFQGGPFSPEGIVIGDGIITRLIEMGLGQNGPDFVHAHEFSHQLQFDMNVFDDYAEPSPEDTRDGELMADALSAYFLSHDEGANMTTDQILELHRAAFSVGDCNIDDNGHHGTPSQRRCASMWGASLAIITSGQRKLLRGRELQNTYIIDPSLFVDMFEDALDGILALSTEACPLLSADDVAKTCPAGKVPITLIIQLDQWASETSWTITGESNDTEVSKTYSNNNNFELVSEIVCVSPDVGYVFSLSDEYGDGIFGGYYKIYSGITTSDQDALLIQSGEITGSVITENFSLVQVVESRNTPLQNASSLNTTDPETEVSQNTTNTTEPDGESSSNATNTTEPSGNTTNKTEPSDNTTHTTEPDDELSGNKTNTTETDSSSIQNSTGCSFPLSASSVTTTTTTTTTTVSNSTTTAFVDPDTHVVTTTTITISNETKITTPLSYE